MQVCLHCSLSHADTNARWGAAGKQINHWEWIRLYIGDVVHWTKWNWSQSCRSSRTPLNFLSLHFFFAPSFWLWEFKLALKVACSVYLLAFVCELHACLNCLKTKSNIDLSSHVRLFPLKTVKKTLICIKILWFCYTGTNSPSTCANFPFPWKWLHFSTLRILSKQTELFRLLRETNHLFFLSAFSGSKAWGALCLSFLHTDLLSYLPLHQGR